MAAPQAIMDLVERFDRNVESYRSGQYNETQLRQEFINPLFNALGWDVDNEKGYAEASKARVKYFTYKEYVDRWDEIATVFSREEVLRGSFDKYVESSKAKRGTAEVDAAFLREIEAWRDMLARNIALL